MARQVALQRGKSGFKLEHARNSRGLGDCIGRYFNGELDSIDAIPVATGGTPFKRKVWQELRDIPCGATTIYGELARRIGIPLRSEP